MSSLQAIVMAGGIGERVRPLTQSRAKSAVPFGGTFRIIDLTLSNFVNSGIRQVDLIGFLCVIGISYSNARVRVKYVLHSLF